MMKSAFGDRVASEIGRQLAHPAGWKGLAIGTVMRIANRRPTRALLEALDVQSHNRLLDVGCGDGVALAMVQRCAWRCGIDRSATMVEAAQRRLRRDIEVGRASVRLGEMAKLPFGSRAFDRIMISNALYFCEDIPAFIAECRRVSRPGARLGMYVTERETMSRWPFAGAATHRSFSAAELGNELRSSGISDDDMAITPLKLPGGMKGVIAVARL